MKIILDGFVERTRLQQLPKIDAAESDSKNELWSRHAVAQRLKTRL